MILTFWNKREVKSLTDLAKSVELSGKRNIARAKAIMETKVAFEGRDSNKRQKIYRQ